MFNYYIMREIIMSILVSMLPTIMTTLLASNPVQFPVEGYADMRNRELSFNVETNQQMVVIGCQKFTMGNVIETVNTQSNRKVVFYVPRDFDTSLDKIALDDNLVYMADNTIIVNHTDDHTVMCK